MANSDSDNNVVPQNRMIEEQSEEVNPKIGYNRGKRWSDDENNVLKSLLDGKSWKYINWKDIRDEEKLFGRDLKAIQVRARNFFRRERQKKEFMESLVKRKSMAKGTVEGLKSLIQETLTEAFATEFIKNTSPDLQVGSTAQGKKVKKVAENSELPWDVLDIISKTLDFDDLFRFAAVCKNWRAFYWRNLLVSQEPLLLQMSYLHHKESYSFISLPDQKIYLLKMMNFISYVYVTSSSGYFITAGFFNQFMLINPFTRIKKVITASTFKVVPVMFENHALLAFDKCSEEFVLVVSCKSSRILHVYQSRNRGWIAYSTMENLGRVVDFMVLHNIIYVVTDKANIGVLSLNSACIKFLKLKSIPDITSLYLRLVNCDEQLLVVDLSCQKMRNVYKIDFSTMNYIKLETLGNIALFYADKRNCYALSNPNRWGYESNSVYVINLSTYTHINLSTYTHINLSTYTQCSVYSGDGKNLQKCITLPAPHGGISSMLDWYFRHLRYEVDYSLVE